MSSPVQWTVQLAQPWDFNCIINDWCADENVNVSRQTGEDPEVFAVGQRARIFRLLQTCQCAVIRPTAAWFAEHQVWPDPKKLLGWVCYSLDRATLRPIVHFTYVKADYRGQGLADTLIAAAGVRPEHGAWCTHYRLRLRKAAKARGIEYNRFLLDYDPAAKTPKQDPYKP